MVLLLELRRPYSSTYWTNIADRAVPFLGLIEHTNLVPAERYPARYLYVSNYVAADEPIARMSADDLLAHCLPALQANYSARLGREVAEHIARDKLGVSTTVPNTIDA